MAEKISCLYRLYGKTTTQLIRLDDQEKVTIGRHEDNDYVLTESPTVSRFHVRITKSKQSFLIEDAGSSNGVWINGVRIDKGHLLRNGDKVEIGKDPRSDEPSIYSYQYYKQAKVQRREKGSSELDPGQSDVNHKDAVPRLRRLCDAATMSTAQLRQKMMEQEERLQQEFGEKQRQKMMEQEERLQQEFAEKQRASEEALKELSEQLGKKSEEQAELEQRLEKQQAMERAKECAMDEMRARLTAKAAEQERLQQTVEEKRAEVEAQLEEKKKNLEEAQKARAKLEQEMQEKLKNEEKKHAAEIKVQIEAQSDMLEAKEAQQQQLQEQLGTLKTEVEEEKKRSEAAKQEYITHVEDAMEDELVCSICAELLVQSSSLNCSHSFCSLCIQKWMLRKKECPNCRKPITSSVKSLVLDNYINKVVGFLSKDLQDRRKILIEERKEEQRLFEAQRAADVVIIDDVPAAIREVTVQLQPANLAQLGHRTYIIPLNNPAAHRPQVPQPPRLQSVVRPPPRPQQQAGVRQQQAAALRQHQAAGRQQQAAGQRANLQQLQQLAQQQMEQRLQQMREQMLTNARAPPNNANAPAQAPNANTRPARGQARTRGGTRGGPYTRATNTNQQGRGAAR